MNEKVKRCGNCRWHFDLLGTLEKGGVKHCLARPWPFVQGILSTIEAECDLPEQYSPKDEKNED